MSYGTTDYILCTTPIFKRALRAKMTMGECLPQEYVAKYSYPCYIWKDDWKAITKRQGRI